MAYQKAVCRWTMESDYPLTALEPTPGYGVSLVKFGEGAEHLLQQDSLFLGGRRRAVAFLDVIGRVHLFRQLIEWADNCSGLYVLNSL